MDKTIIVYTCKDEFKFFQGVERVFGDYYSYKLRCDGNACFFAIRDIGDDRTFTEKQAVRRLLSVANIVSARQNTEGSKAHLSEMLAKYLQVIYHIISNHFQDSADFRNYHVVVITHWGGGGREDIDMIELCVKDAVGEIEDDRFADWETWSASEAMRPGLFSPEYNTAMARKHEKSAKLPDSQECEKILHRLKHKCYGTPFVDMDEKDARVLFYDIMKHLNH